MSEERKSFVFYSDWYDAICGLDDTTALEVSKAIMKIALCKGEPNLSQTAQAMMMLIRPQIQRDIEKWLDIRTKRQEVGRMGGLAKQAIATNCYQLLPNDSKSKQNLANEAVNVNVNVDNNNVIYKEEKDSKEKEIEEFVEYIYKLYPTKCPVRMISTGKSVKDKKRIEGLLKRYSMEDIERVVKKEVEDKLGKHPLKNFSTFLNNFPDPNDMFTKTGYGYPQSVADVKPDDINNTLIQFQYWLDRAAPTLCDNLRGGWPETEQQYQNMIKSTVGGATALSYVVLVFNRDGWDEYYDERGFMWTYLNYIKANGLYEG